MKTKKLLLSAGLAALLGAQVHALSYDFDIGYGAGFSTGLRIMDREDMVVHDFIWGDITISHSDPASLTWQTGGFVGAGVDFETAVPMALGLEYTGNYVADTQTFKTGFSVPGVPRFGAVVLPDSSVLVANNTDKIETFDQFLDVYYKVGLMKVIPMTLQLDIGMAMRLGLGSYFNGTRSAATGPFALGLHAGMRASMHMFFLGMDYTFLPSYNYSAADMASDQSSGGKANALSVSMGVTLNKWM